MESMLSRLRGDIGQLRKLSTCNRSFINPQDLRVLLTKDAIKRAVKECRFEEHDLPGIVSKIHDQGITIFAILVWMKEEDAVLNFIEHDAMDARLPIEEGRAKEIIPDFGEHFSREVQWEFLPRMFEKNMSNNHVRIRKEVILPFIEESPLGEGSFGDVFLMSVVPSQQQFFPEQTSTVFVIRKRLKIKRNQEKNTAERVFRREIECLKLLHRLQHDNIIKLLGSYTYRGEHNLLFPRLEMDLEAFLKRDERFGEFKWNFTFYTALQGLSSALQSLHNLKLNTQEHNVDLARIGVHHDIRPANILVNHKTFILADFGLARVKPVEGNSQTVWPNGGADNTAPECMAGDFARQSVGRPIDIWAFGCIVAEVATYIERGSRGVAEFSDRRKGPAFALWPSWNDRFFFQGDGLKPGLISWFRELSVNPEDRQLYDLLEMARYTLRIDPQERPKAMEVCEKMSFLSVTSLFCMVQGAFVAYFESAKLQVDGPSSMNIWFERERLNAWGAVLGVTNKHRRAAEFERVNDLGPRCRDILLRIFHQLDSHILPGPVQESEAAVISLSKPLHEELQGLVQELWDLLPPGYQKRMELVWRETSLETDDISSLRDIESSSLSVGKRLYSEVSAVAAMKALRLEISATARTGEQSFLLDIQDLKREKELQEDQWIGMYRKDTQVLIEYIVYTSKHHRIPVAERGLRMELLAEALHKTPKPAGFRVLDCIGFVESMDCPIGYGFLYVFPKSPTGAKLVPQTLLNSFLRKSKSRRTVGFKPLLGARFRLASILVSCLAELHTVGFLHKNINSSNIIFFKEDTELQSSLRSFEEPYLINFRHSRPGGESFETEGLVGEEGDDVYRHPDYNGKSRFQEIYDYYSIGLVLLEIGLWEPLQWLSDRYPTATPSEFRENLSKSHVGPLGQIMGETYRNIVQICLDGNFDKLGGECTGGLSGRFGQFYEKVVEPLGELARCPI